MSVIIKSRVPDGHDPRHQAISFLVGVGKSTGEGPSAFHASCAAAGLPERVDCHWTASLLLLERQSSQLEGAKSIMARQLATASGQVASTAFNPLHALGSSATTIHRGLGAGWATLRRPGHLRLARRPAHQPSGPPPTLGFQQVRRRSSSLA